MQPPRASAYENLHLGQSAKDGRSGLGLPLLLEALGKRAASSDKLLGKQALWATLTNAILLKIHGQALGLVFWVIGAFPVLEILAAPASMLLFPLREGKQAFPEDATLGPS